MHPSHGFATNFMKAIIDERLEGTFQKGLANQRTHMIVEYPL
jgi:hypothetical protein